MFEMVTTLISERKIPDPQRTTDGGSPAPSVHSHAQGHRVFRLPRLRTGTTTTIRAPWTCFLPLRCHWRSELRASERRRSLSIPPTGRLS